MLYPPWRATAIRITTRYGNVEGMQAQSVVDTVEWPLEFAPIAAAPRTPFTTTELQQIVIRAHRGDSTARDELRLTTQSFEERYHVPEALRASAAFWRDSVLSAAGIPSVTTYHVTFAIDDARLALRLGLLGAVAMVTEWKAVRRRSSRRLRAVDHPQ